MNVFWNLCLLKYVYFKLLLKLKNMPINTALQFVNHKMIRYEQQHIEFDSVYLLIL